MTLIVENGSGVPNANSYVSLEEATQYHLLYRNEDWDGTDDDLEQALILATQSIDLLYGPQYLSVKKLNSTGPLLFPRMPFYDNNGIVISDTTIPRELKSAVCEIALMQYTGTDIFPLSNTEGNIKVNRIKVGEIEIENEYSGTQGSTETYSSFGKVDKILYAILKQKNNKTRILR